MTPEQALNILTRATAQISANREVHDQIKLALQTIHALFPKEKHVELVASNSQLLDNKSTK